MSERTISAALRREVISRAGNRYEYCLLPAEVAFFPHEVDHVIALKHQGATEAANLAFACWRCNRHKGSDLGSFDPLTQHFSLLFNPRHQGWSDHFMFQGAQLIGLTAEGRTTIQLLRLNSEERLAERQRLIENSQYGVP
jgi:hypothetical protein